MKKQFKLHSNKNNEGPIEHSHMGSHNFEYFVCYSLHKLFASLTI
jgi:hypothetical protein